MKVAVVLIVIAIQLHFATAPPSPGVWGSIGKGFSWVGKKVFRITPKVAQVAPKVVQPSVTVAQKAVSPKLTTEVSKAMADRAEAEKQKNLGNDFYK